jgi:hypothetical protein
LASASTCAALIWPGAVSFMWPIFWPDVSILGSSGRRAAPRQKPKVRCALWALNQHTGPPAS